MQRGSVGAGKLPLFSEGGCADGTVKGTEKRTVKGTEKQRQDAAGISSRWKTSSVFGRRLRGRDGFRRDQATVDRLVRA
jgi:hypothetical protein